MLTRLDFTPMKTNNVMLENSVADGCWRPEPDMNRNPDVDMKQLEALLSGFNSHKLGDLDNADLMNRVDTKYLLPVSDLEKFLLLIHPFYTVLEIESSRIFTYQTTYFDTPEFGFYLMHHNGKMNRFKIRHRLYVDSGDLYMELKHKTNKRVTQKTRVLINGHNGSGNRGQDRIATLASKPFEGRREPLLKSLVCAYVRIAMANEKNGERLTLDLNLSFKDPNQMRLKKFNQILIAEVKRENRKASSVFMDMMDRFHHKPISFSKYCIGCSLLHSEQIKTNRFKETLMALDQICH